MPEVFGEEIIPRINVQRPPRWLRPLLYFKKPYIAHDWESDGTLKRTIIAKKLFGIYYIVGSKVDKK